MSARRHRRAIYVGLVIFASLHGATTQSAEAEGAYSVVDFGALPQGITKVIRGPNSLGEVVGGSITFGSGLQAFLLTTTRLERVDGLPGTRGGLVEWALRDSRRSLDAQRHDSRASR
jgi:hypothetical protein